MPNQALKTTGRQLIKSVTEGFTVPALIEDAGLRAKRKFVEFFAAEIENDDTRAEARQHNGTRSRATRLAEFWLPASLDCDSQSASPFDWTGLPIP